MKKNSKIGRIKQTTQNKNLYEYKKIENDYINEIPIQKVTYRHLQEFLDLHRYLSQSELNKMVQKLKAGFNRAVLEKLIAYADNPMLRVQVPVSFKDTKQVVAFDLEEEINLLKYIAVNDRLIKSDKCNYDDNTIRNLIICALFTGARIGELGSIDYTKHIDFKSKNLIVTSTLTKDKDGNVILGNETKTGRYKKLRSKKDIRYVPFALFDSDILIHILENQIKIAKENKSNKNHLLFCQENGEIINHIAVNSIFKRICREAKVKLELETGCHFHMTRHTAITRLIEMGTNLMVIASWVGHTSTRQIEETYGHILLNFQNWQLEHPGEYYKKEDLITEEIKNLLLNL